MNKIVLNDGEPLRAMPVEGIALKLKDTMNMLRGAFFDAKGGRVAYERMRGSQVYKEYVQLSYTLKHMNLSDLADREEQLAFWINLYNVIVIHGVIAMGVRDSVKEVRYFFRRIRYQIGDMFFTPDDIEHGILRGNRRAPNTLFKLFQENDRRREFVIEPVDPRVHFALVCASSSCPPIEVYTRESIEKELNIAAETFLNAGGIRIDRARRRVFLSRIFKWYGDDFAPTAAERLRFIAPYLHDDEEKRFLEENANSIRIAYQKYDWRLNRS